MNAERRSTRLAVAPCVSRIAASAVLALSAGSALAQTATSAAAGASAPGTRSAFAVMLERLEGAPLALVLVAIAIVGLLAWRIFKMVRGERPSARKKSVPRTVRARSEPEIEPTTIQRSTDWGADQDKRSSVVRADPSVRARDPDLAPLDQGTQWPPIDRHSAAGFGVLLPDALGQSPAASPSPYRTGGFNPYYHVGGVENHIEVEEIADTLTQAELLVQLGDPKEAMSLLARHIRETERPGPAVWLMLLGLYQSTGREAQYNALSDGFRTLFNADVPPWAAKSEVAARDLESYPRVIEKLRTAWPRPECRVFIEGLLTDDRGGSRQGFSLGAYRELLFLVEILDVLERQLQESSDQHDIDRKLSLEP